MLLVSALMKIENPTMDKLKLKRDKTCAEFSTLSCVSAWECHVIETITETT